MIIETERLILRPFEAADVDAIATINADSETMRFFPTTMSRQQTLESLDRYRQSLEDNGISFLCAEYEPTGETIGIIGLNRYDEISRAAIPGRPEFEVGWRLRRDMWGKGLAPEGASACLQYGFEAMDLDEIVAITCVPNLPSRRVMEKIGMTFDKSANFMHPKVPDGHPLKEHVTYRAFNPARAH